MTRVARLKFGVSAEIFSQIARILVLFVEMPIALLYWGTDKYAEWLVLFALPSYFTVVVSGLVLTASREMIRRMAADQAGNAVRIYSGLCTLLCWSIGLGSFFAVAGFIASNGYGEWFEQIGYGRDVIYCVCGVVVYLVLTIWWSVLSTPLSAKLHYSVVISNGALAALLESFLFICGAVYGGWSLTAGAICYCIGRLVCIVILQWQLRNKTPEFRFKCGPISFLRPLLMPSAGTVLIGMGTALNNSGLRYAVSVSIGPGAVIALVAVRTATRIVFQIINSLKKVLEPELSSAYASGGFEFTRKVYRVGLSLVAVMSSALSVILIMLWPQVSHYWLHGQVSIERTTVALFCVVALVNGLWLFSLSLLSSNNMQQRVALGMLTVYGFIPFVTVLYYPGGLGLNAVAAILLIAEIAVLVHIVNLIHAHLDTEISLTYVFKSCYHVGDLLKLGTGAMNRVVSKFLRR